MFLRLVMLESLEEVVLRVILFIAVVVYNMPQNGSFGVIVGCQASVVTISVKILCDSALDEVVRTFFDKINKRINRFCPLGPLLSRSLLGRFVLRWERGLSVARGFRPFLLLSVDVKRLEHFFDFRGRDLLAIAIIV